MRTTRDGGRFIVIGENIHATRVLQRAGKYVASAPDGHEAIRFAGADGAERFLTIPDAIQDGQDYAQGRVKHVRAALLAVLSGRAAEAAEGRAYLVALARRQIEAGADYLDLNVDEVAEDLATQQAAIRLLVAIVEPISPVPVALDSSDAAVIEAGLDVAQYPAQALLNSASLERLDVLDLAARAGSAVVASAAGLGGLPADAEERVAKAARIVDEARVRGIPLERVYLDPLVMPVAVDPSAGAYYLEAVRRIRLDHGPAIHITGGLSNVSFGLPARRLVNDVFIDLAADAGADSGIIDPVASDPARVFGRDRASRTYRLAADLLTGADPYGMEFLTSYRAGELADA